MENHIKVTSRRLPKIISTSPKLDRIDGAVVAEALKAERIEMSVPGIVISSESHVPEKLATVNKNAGPAMKTETAMPTPPDQPNRLERLASEKQPSIAAEFLGFLSENKKWWLLPILIITGLFGIAFALAANPAIAPFIYTMW